MGISFRGLPIFCVAWEQIFANLYFKDHHREKIFAEFGHISLPVSRTKPVYMATRDVIYCLVIFYLLMLLVVDYNLKLPKGVILNAL